MELNAKLYTRASLMQIVQMLQEHGGKDRFIRLIHRYTSVDY